MVRKGSSYVPGYANKCSKTHGKADPSEGFSPPAEAMLSMVAFCSFVAQGRHCSGLKNQVPDFRNRDARIQLCWL